MRCPACSATLGAKGRCHACEGVWLDEEHVRERAARELEYTGGKYSERRCPICDEEMDEPLVFDIPIDRCETHGMWFDKAELDEVLHRSRSDQWRHHGGAASHPAHAPDQIDALIAVMRMWRRSS